MTGKDTAQADVTEGTLEFTPECQLSTVPGHPGNLSPEQQDKVDKFRKLVRYD